MTLDAPSLLGAERSLTSARTRTASRNIAAAQARAKARLLAAIPSAQIVERYRIVADGFALVVPTRDVTRLTSIPGIAKVWPNLVYHSLSTTRTTVTRAQALSQGPQVIGADKLWGNGLETAGEGIKIGVIDDGIDAKHQYFDPAAFSYPAGFPKGIKADTTPKVIVQRAFAPALPVYRYETVPVRSVRERLLPRNPRGRDRRRRPQHA